MLLHCRCSMSRGLETRLWCRDHSQSLWVQPGPFDIGFPSSFCAGPVQLSASLAVERITPSSPECDYGPCCVSAGQLAASSGWWDPSDLLLAQRLPHLPRCLPAADAGCFSVPSLPTLPMKSNLPSPSVCTEQGKGDAEPGQ